ncbi:hypothetical protein [Pseudarthrobacter oxydans]|uniref:hypothetical protein n=1 Tax=Pseudarthrobacter oxydans TaxID=1671 RepID=UPI0035E7B8FB|nr:hypothetical protein GCM10017547_38450 [Pseudarthrobacter oxydans]
MAIYEWQATFKAQEDTRFISGEFELDEIEVDSRQVQKIAEEQALRKMTRLYQEPQLDSLEFQEIRKVRETPPKPGATFIVQCGWGPTRAVLDYVIEGTYHWRDTKGFRFTSSGISDAREV